MSEKKYVTFLRSYKFIPMIAFWCEITKQIHPSNLQIVDGEIEDILLEFWLPFVHVYWWIQISNMPKI